MTRKHAIDLYGLLPALYRMRDAERGYPLRALLEIIADQVDVVKENIDGLWDDFFIETCDPWVIPYIGELVGNNPLHGEPGGIRADVAKTVYYRRCKGTLPMLEELARDVTGWGAHVVEGFERLGWTQHLDHPRQVFPKERGDKSFAELCPVKEIDPHAQIRVGSVNLRATDSLDRLHGAFDDFSQTVDVRLPQQNRWGHNLQTLTFFLWRLNSYPLRGVEARRYSNFPRHRNRFFVSSLGNPIQVFHQAERQWDEFQLARENHVPAAIRPLALHLRRDDYYGATKGLSVYRGPRVHEDDLVDAKDIISRDLSDWKEPPTGKVALDLALGRICFPLREAPRQVTLSFHYGFSSSIGGGPYRRQVGVAGGSEDSWQVEVSRQDGSAYYKSLRRAIAHMPVGKQARILVADSATYEESIRIDLCENQRLVIEATDGHRPTLRVGTWIRVIGGGPGASLTLNGFLIEGGLQIEAELAALELSHCTLVPGHALGEDGTPQRPRLPSLWSPPNGSGPKTVRIDKCICGALQLADRLQLECRDSILQGLADVPAISAPLSGRGPDPFGPVASLERVTLFGAVFVKQMTRASDVIFMAKVRAERTQQGGLRFCYLDDPVSSLTPPRFRCQPDLLSELRFGSGKPGGEGLQSLVDEVRPRFTSTLCGEPGYAQLRPATSKEILQGAEGGSEMGVFHDLRQAQREADLRLRLEEYLPFGMTADLVYVT